MSAERSGGLRAQIAAEAARLMYEEEVKQYFTAKRMAAKRLLGRVGGKRLRYRPQDLPSNGEIRDALLLLAELAEGDRRTRRLFAMRIVALEAMRTLVPFTSRLIGSVSTGHIRRGSDIDLSVFTDNEDALEVHLRKLGWTFETERVTILKFGQLREYMHIHVADVFPIELTVYALRELRFRPRSSTDGKPIRRLNIAAVEGMLVQDHPDEWEEYLSDGTITHLDEVMAEADDDDAPVPGPFDGLLGLHDDNRDDEWEMSSD
ncbi:MAG TPA: nucleotidyltransferase domain-containing protein [Polyangium sp.]|nr:nucleotidyltransferase domain-containing protein [Polyangium sp.]